MRKNGDTRLDAQYAMVLRSVGSAMEQFGYVKKGGDRFVKWNGDVLLRVALVLNKERRAGDRGTVTGFVCVGFRSVAKILAEWGGPMNSRVVEPCAMAASLHLLTPSRNPLQWSLAPGSDPENLSAQIMECVVKYGFPYFEQYGSMEKSLHAWEHGVFHNMLGVQFIYMGAAYEALGRHEEAIALVAREVARMETEAKAAREGLRLSEEATRDFLAFLRSRSG